MCRYAEGGAASVVASLAGGYTNPMAAATPAAVAAADANASHKPGKVAKPSAKKPAAKKQKVAKAATPPVDKVWGCTSCSNPVDP